MRLYFVSIIAIVFWAPSAFAEYTEATIRPLTLNDFVGLIVAQDELIRSQKIEVDIAREGIRGAEAIFEPAFFASFGYENRYTPNTAIEAKQRQGTVSGFGAVRDSDEFRLKEYQYKAGLLWKSPLGSDLELSYNINDGWNSLQQDVYGGDWDNNGNTELKSYLGVKLSQPLLRGFGWDFTRAEIDIAETEKLVADESVRQLLVRRLMEGVSAYFNTQKARERVRLRKESLKVSEMIAVEMMQQVGFGFRSQVDLKKSKAAYSLRQLQLSLAQQELEESQSKLQEFIGTNSGQPSESPSFTRVETVDALVSLVPDEQTLTLKENRLVNTVDESFYRAVTQRPESRVNKIRISRETLKVDKAKNLTLPELILTASYGKDDVSTDMRSFGDYFDGDIPYNSWAVQLQFKYHLFGDEKSDSEFKAAKLRRQQLEWAQSALHNRIANELQSSLRVLQKAQQQVDQQQKIIDTQKELLGLEQTLLDDGRSSTLNVLNIQLEVLLAEEAWTDGIALLNRASYLVSQSEGSVLFRLGLE